MNFVGHAMAARWEHDDPRFVLGAMLPDLAPMCGARLLAVDDEVLAAGVACHHRADAAFHQAPAFSALCAEARAWLRAAGLARGPVLAAAHVGVELLLDGCWLDDPAVDRAYLDAIAHATRLPAGAIVWAHDEHARRFTLLGERLHAAGSPRAYRDPVEVGLRLARILARRPRLSPAPGDEEQLVRWAEAARPGVIQAAPTLQAELRAGLNG
jgi:hypothetical protein